MCNGSEQLKLVTLESVLMGRVINRVGALRTSWASSKRSRGAPKPVDSAEPWNDLVPTGWQRGRHIRFRRAGESGRRAGFRRADVGAWPTSITGKSAAPMGWATG